MTTVAGSGGGGGDICCFFFKKPFLVIFDSDNPLILCRLCVRDPLESLYDTW